MDKEKSSDNQSSRTDERMSPQQWRSSMLEEAMEPIFHPSSDRFSLADLQDGSNVEISPHFDENDYELHRRESMHHHQPLHRLHHRHRRPSHIHQEEIETDLNQTDQETENESEPQDPLLSKSKETETVLPCAASSDEDKVQFYVGSASSLEKTSSVVTLSDKLASTSHGIKTPLKSVLRGTTLKDTETVTSSMSPSSKQHGFASTSLQTPALQNVSVDDFLDPSPVPTANASATVLTDSSDTPQGKPKVTFLLGEEEKNDDPEKEKISPSKKAHKHSRRHHHKSHDSLSRRKHQGSDVETKSYQDVLEPEEAETLQTADIDDMASHRFEDPKAIRRHKIQAKSSVASFIHLSRKDGSDNHVAPFVKKLFDHQPHEIFVELDELLPGEDGEELEWKETARWIKYEEDVEEGSDRWGKPHIASLSFHSLLNLRKCLETGTVLLDLDEKDLTGIAHQVVESMIVTDQIKTEQKGAIMRALLLRHRHVNEKSHAPFLRRNSSGYANLNMLSHERTKSPRFLRASRTIVEESSRELISADAAVSQPETKILMPNSSNLKDVEIVPTSKRKSFISEDGVKLDTSILRRIPFDSEATTVLVGALDFLDQPTIAFVRLAHGQVMPHLMELLIRHLACMGLSHEDFYLRCCLKIPIPVRFLFVLLGPLDSGLDYHEIGRSISTLMSNRRFHDAAYKAEDRKDLLRSINEFLDDSIVLPPCDWEKRSLLPVDEIRRKSMQIYRRDTAQLLKKEEPDRMKPPPYDPLKRTGCCFGGFWNDIKHRYPWYLSDLRDGLNSQCFAAVIFIYFAALSGAITFGGLLGEKTGQLIGVSETLVVTCVYGIIFSLLSCQPLVIIGTTGPVMLFDELLFQFCKSNNISFLTMRVWIGIWTGIISTIVVAFEGSSLVRFFSRFMQEIFATIISLLFIMESLKKLYQIFVDNPLKKSYCDHVNNTIYNISSTAAVKDQPNTALLSTFLMIGTFYIALFLRHFRNSKFLGRSARRALGDFGIPIGIITMVLMDFIIHDVETQKLSVPEGLKPSNQSARGWLISPVPVGPWEALGASVAGLLIFILLFLETQICELIISKKDRKLKKGSGFHVDMMLISYMEIGCALLGGPWLCATTIRSISHVASLTVMSKTHAPGETPHIVEVKEQRLTNLFVSTLIGISVLMAPLLRHVPVAVLFGVFLYMGISSLSGIQLYERIILLFMPVKHHPDFSFVRKVRTWKMHMYTVIQIFCIVILWIVQVTEAALALPFFLLMLVPLRSQLKCCFTQSELKALDGEEAAEEKQIEEEPDFYEQIVA